MDIRSASSIRAKRDVKQSTTDIQTISVEAVVSTCRKYLQDNSTEYSGKTGEERKSLMQNLITKYVSDTKPYVVGFIGDGGVIQLNDLINRITQDIMDYGILSSAMSDEKVFEIQVNGKEIKVEKGGRIVDYTDDKGRVVSFSSPSEQEIIFKRLLGDVRLTPKDVLANARTIEGYRVAGVHSSGIALDTLYPSNNGYGYIVIRKFKKQKLSIQDIVKFGTLSDGMGIFLSTMLEGGCTYVTVGPTSSGKTTLNQAILTTLPDDLRALLIQNPSEIDLAHRDSTGRVLNNVIHLEARNIENPTANDPTMENFMNQALRLSPTYIVFGELRSDTEFARAMTAALAGHAFNCTYHAEDSLGAFTRYINAYRASTGSDWRTAIMNLTGAVNFIIVQRIMKDGTRKVLQITEVVGVDPDNQDVPLLNDLYVFETADTVYDEFGRIVEITGKHKRVGKLSQRTVEKFKLNGVKKEKYEFLLNDVGSNELETYTGDFTV